MQPPIRHRNPRLVQKPEGGRPAEALGATMAPRTRGRAAGEAVFWVHLSGDELRTVLCNVSTLRDLMSARAVCKAWAVAVSDSCVWRALAHRIYPPSQHAALYSAFSAMDVSWQARYRLLHRRKARKQVHPEVNSALAVLQTEFSFYLVPDAGCFLPRMWVVLPKYITVHYDTFAHMRSHS